MIAHTFTKSAKAGDIGEAALDSYFSRWYTITAVNRERQKQGIDREFVSKLTSMTYSVEYKTDDKAANSKNVFIELVSVDKDGKPGWAYYSQAQLLACYIPTIGEIILMDMVQLKLALPTWLKTCKQRPARNYDDNGNFLYNTIGLLVPLKKFKQCCIKSLFTPN